MRTSYVSGAATMPVYVRCWSAGWQGRGGIQNRGRHERKRWSRTNRFGEKILTTAYVPAAKHISSEGRFLVAVKDSFACPQVENGVSPIFPSTLMPAKEIQVSPRSQSKVHFRLDDQRCGATRPLWVPKRGVHDPPFGPRID